MAEQVQVPVQPEVEPMSQWEADGFLRELGNLCAGLEGVAEEHIFTPEIRQIIDTILNLKTVEDFADYSNNQLADYMNILRREVPKIEREVMQFVNQISRAKSVAFEVEFI